MEIPEVRYTQENQTPIAEMSVQLDGLRPGDPPSLLKVVGWGNLAQDLHNRVEPGQRLVLEGRLRMSTLARKDGLKEKRAEFTLSRLHPVGTRADQPAHTKSTMTASSPTIAHDVTGGSPTRQFPPTAPGPATSQTPVWNTSPLNPDDAIAGDDDIPF